MKKWQLVLQKCVAFAEGATQFSAIEEPDDIDISDSDNDFVEITSEAKSYLNEIISYFG
jgi:hypothetical protein